MRKFIPIFVFVIYINDLEDYLLNKNVTGLSTITEGIEKELIYIQKCLSCMFYADDTVILAKSANNIQFGIIL